MPRLRNRSKPLLAALCACGLLLTGALAEASSFAARAIPMGFTALAGVSMDQAIQMAERQYGAKVVRASVSEDNGRRVYVLRLVSEQGRVWTVRVDAATGSMM
jgi:Peptidase propeptide and YPEB domain